MGLILRGVAREGRPRSQCSEHVGFLSQLQIMRNDLSICLPFLLLCANELSGNGTTPFRMHFAYSDAVRTLLAFGADLHTQDSVRGPQLPRA
jgi:hypothetical protein